MSEGINKVILFGNLGADAEILNTAKGAVCKMRLATTEKWKDKDGQKKENTERHRNTLFGSRAETLGPSLKKGQHLFVEGHLRTSSYEKDGQKRWSTDIIADQIRFGGMSSNGQYTSRPPPASVSAETLPF
jgi:single-strand DNA-binding protein